MSKLKRIIDTTQIEEKIMDTPIRLSIHEILAISEDVVGYLHDQTRKHRIPIEDAPAPGTAVQAAITATSMSSVDVNLMDSKSYYAPPSGHAKVTLDDQIMINATLDNESEINMIS